MKYFILAMVDSVGVATDPKDLEKGLGFIVVVESSKKIADSIVPDFINFKSAVKLEAGEHLLEVEVFNMSQNGGRLSNIRDLWIPLLKLWD